MKPINQQDLQEAFDKIYEGRIELIPDAAYGGNLFGVKFSGLPEHRYILINDVENYVEIGRNVDKCIKFYDVDWGITAQMIVLFYAVVG